MITSAAMTIFPKRRNHDGVPCHRVSSLPAIGACAAGEATAVIGRPHCGQDVAAVETSRPQSGHLINAIAQIVSCVASCQFPGCLSGNRQPVTGNPTMNIGGFLLALIAIFLSAKIFGELASRIGQPAVLGELIGGVLVGVSGLRLVDPHDPTVSLLAQLGIILLLFLIGLNTNLYDLMRVGFAAIAVAVVGVALTFAGGFVVAHLLGFANIVSVFLGASLTATSVGITARVLADLGHLQDREAQSILGAAVVYE